MYGLVAKHDRFMLERDMHRFRFVGSPRERNRGGFRRRHLERVRVVKRGKVDWYESCKQVRNFELYAELSARDWCSRRALATSARDGCSRQVFAIVDRTKTKRATV